MTAHVTRWWNDGPSLAAIEADYGGVVDGTEPAAAFIAYRDAVPIGLIQRYRVDAYRNMKRSWNTSCLFPTRLAASTT